MRYRLVTDERPVGAVSGQRYDSAGRFTVR